MPIPFAEGLGGTEMIILGVLILGTAFLLRRTGVRSANIRKRDVAAEVRREFAQAEQQGRNNLDRFAVRIHDYAREVDALTQTRIAILRELTAAADRAIAELQSELASDRSTGDHNINTDRIAVLLSEAGHAPSTIATLLNRPESDVRTVIEESASKNCEFNAA